MIDFHTHTFPDNIAGQVIHKLSLDSCTLPFSDGTLSGLLHSMQTAGVDYSVTLPVMTNTAQVEKINGSIITNKDTLFAQGIVAFGGLHPDYANYKQELHRLADSGIKGIKLHPAYQNIDLDDIRMLRIIDAASELGLIVLIHAGMDIGIYDHNYSSVSHILKVIDEIHPPKFVLAHMGNWGCWEEVESDLAGAPVYLDTAFAIGAITPAPYAKKAPLLSENLTDDAFVRIVKKHGADKILFATDSPWEDQADYIRRIHEMPLTPEEEINILDKNATKLLQL
ncbi:MAG: metal-dependent hydrolase [Lachnospiraceae bacterium]|nr:metal-dependent hydrolase [Lachnospiraceae bacterium]